MILRRLRRRKQKALIAGLLAVAYHAWRKTIWLEALAAATGTLLLCDAWFDVLLEPGAHFWIAVVEAVAIEIPAAVLCFWIARDSERFWAAVAAGPDPRVRSQAH